jgi:predicted HTH transcriptional regulator
MRVVGLNRVRLSQYPAEPRREALANAVAHRRFEQHNLPKIFRCATSNLSTQRSPKLG